MFLLLKLEKYFAPTLTDSVSILKQRINLQRKWGWEEIALFTDITEYVHIFLNDQELVQMPATKKSLRIWSAFSFKTTFWFFNEKAFQKLHLTLVIE